MRVLLDTDVTRNAKDFSQATMTVLTPAEFLARLTQSRGEEG
jgi:hypothetical protein